jgi:hypothetical protein
MSTRVELEDDAQAWRGSSSRVGAEADLKVGEHAVTLSGQAVAVEVAWCMWRRKHKEGERKTVDDTWIPLRRHFIPPLKPKKK